LFILSECSAVNILWNMNACRPFFFNEFGCVIYGEQSCVIVSSTVLSVLHCVKYTHLRRFLFSSLMYFSFIIIIIIIISHIDTYSMCTYTCCFVKDLIFWKYRFTYLKFNFLKQNIFWSVGIHKDWISNEYLVIS